LENTRTSREENMAKRTTKAADLKEQLEAITGRKIADLSAEQFQLFFPITASTYLRKHDPDDDAWVTERVLIFGRPPINYCTDGNIFDTSGFLGTGPDGKLVFRLLDVICGRRSFGFLEPVHLLATPQGASPVYITMAHRLIPNDTNSFFSDVEITALTWKPNGTPAPNVNFYWRCRVAVSEPFF
jgi:hypothetical protein